VPFVALAENQAPGGHDLKTFKASKEIKDRRGVFRFLVAPSVAPSGVSPGRRTAHEQTQDESNREDSKIPVIHVSKPSDGY
jgi:hypothetical protein